MASQRTPVVGESDRAFSATSTDARVYGEVQGVGFRLFVVAEAQRLGRVGWVRNRRDDSVEVTAEGERVALGRCLEALRRGPRLARVETVTEEWLPATGEFRQFWILSAE